MFEIDPRVAIIAAYEAVTFLTLALMAQGLQKNKDREREFDCEHFFYFSFWLPLMMQVGFVALGYALLYDNHAATRTLTELAIILWPTLGLYLLALFAFRYHRVENFVRRLERLEPLERSAILEKLPARKFRQLPGDYRIVSQEMVPVKAQSFEQLPELVRRQILEALYRAERR
jgi:hypothetical protein